MWYFLPPELHTRSTCSLQQVLVFDSIYTQDTCKHNTYSPSHTISTGGSKNLYCTIVCDLSFCDTEKKTVAQTQTAHDMKPGETTTRIRWANKWFCERVPLFTWLEIRFILQLHHKHSAMILTNLKARKNILYQGWASIFPLGHMRNPYCRWGA